jgi:hypothetical protein
MTSDLRIFGSSPWPFARVAWVCSLNGLGLVALSAAQVGFARLSYDRGQLVGVDRLLQHREWVERLGALLEIGHRGYEDDRNIGGVGILELSRPELRTTEARHHIVEHDRTRHQRIAIVDLLQPLQPVQPVLGRCDNHPVGLEDELQDLSRISIVLHEQDVG